MDSKQLDHFRDILLKWRQELMEEVDRTVHHMQDEAANFPDPADRATQEEEFSIELRTRDRERRLIKKIDQTIERIDQRRLRLLRHVRRRNRSATPRSPTYRDAVRRLQDAR